MHRLDHSQQGGRLHRLDGGVFVDWTQKFEFRARQLPALAIPGDVAIERVEIRDRIARVPERVDSQPV